MKLKKGNYKDTVKVSITIKCEYIHGFKEQGKTQFKKGCSDSRCVLHLLINLRPKIKPRLTL